MKFTEINDPLDGERTVDVLPRPAPLVDADWVRQRFVTGRSVSAEALDDEMENRAGRIRLLGRAMRPGVVFGLEVGAAEDDDGHQTVITVSPGMGICASGEDVVVPRAMFTHTGAENDDGQQMSALDLPFRRTASIPIPEATDTPTLRDALASWKKLFAAEAAEMRIFRPIERMVRPVVHEMIRSVDRLDFAESIGLAPHLNLEVPHLVGPFVGPLPRRPHPFLAILVVEPVFTEELGAGGAPDDPCERDPEAEPFEDWRYVDGARLAWHSLTEVIDDENAALGEDAQVHWLTWFQGFLGTKRPSPAQARNRAAWALFDIDARRNPAPMPWERDAVPIALVAFNTSGHIEWIDRAAVVRRAGRWIQGESPVPSVGDPALWQARIEQFNDQLATMTLDRNEKLATHLRWLPPVGILPREVYDLKRRATLTFPAKWGISAAPIPLEQLDEVVRTVAALAPFDLAADGDEVKLLVPVDPSNWDPRLLQIAAVHPDFHAALREAEARIERLFASRGELRSKIATLYGALGGDDVVPDFPPDDDPEYQHEWVTRTLVWDSVDAISLFWNLGQTTSGKILQTAAGIKNAAKLLLWSADTESTDANIAGTEIPLLVQAFASAGAEGPVAVVPMGEEEPLVLEAGPGFALPGGWTHSAMVNREDGLAFADDPVLYIVQGVADTEALDRAIAYAGPERRLVILAGQLTDTAIEELHWHHHIDPDRLPLVCVTRGDADTRAARLLDVAIRVGAKDLSDGEWGRKSKVGLVLASQHETIVVDVSGGDAQLIAGQVEVLEKELAKLEEGASARRTVLEQRLRVLKTHAAVLKIPDLLDPHTGGSRVLRARLAAQIIRRMQLVEDMAGVDGTALLRLAAPAREADFGTSATNEGLGSAILTVLQDRLEAAITPPLGVRVLSQAETDLLEVEGIVGLMDLLKEKVSRADDIVDFGFVQIQALTFRIREYLLGRDAALAASSSPILADLSDIIQRNTDPDALQAFFDSLKAAADASDGDGTDGPSGGDLGGRWFTEALNLQVTQDKLFQLVGGYDPLAPFEDLVTLAWDPGIVVTADPVPWWTAGGLGTEILLARGTTPVTEVLPTGVGGVTETGPSGLPTEVVIPEGRVRIPVRVAESPSAPTATGTPLVTGERLRTHDATVATGNMVNNLMHNAGAMAFFADAIAGGQPFAGGVGEPQAGSFTALDKSFDVLSSPSYVYQPALQTQTVTAVASVGIAKMVQAANAMLAMHPVDWTLRSAGIKERIQDPKAVSLRAAAFRLRGSVTQTIHNMSLYIGDLPFPGFLKTDSSGSLPIQETRPIDNVNPAHAANVAEVLQGKHDLISANADIGDLVSDAVKSLETTAAMLRVVEGRIREVRGLLKVCRRARSAVERQVKAAEKRHDLLDQSIAEAKHDLVVTRALLAEERERVEETNTRRGKVLDEEVPFVVFHRSRAIDLHDDLPVHDVEPSMSLWSLLQGAFTGPPPAAPDELREAVDLWRDAPAKWLRSFGSMLERIDQVRAARRALEHARMRAAFRLAEPRVAPPATLVGLQGLNLVAGLVRTRQSHMITGRERAASLNLQHIARFTWKQAQLEVAEVMTLDDILTATDIPASISKRVSQELEWIYGVAAHLYGELTLVEPRIRADWARRMSEFDQPLDLRDLSGLPHWAEVGQGGATSQPDPFRKRELQAYVDWLFGRLHAEPEQDAFALMNDLVRICILLSAHAPVGQIISGHVDEPTPVEPGRLLPIRIDVARLRVGMQALVTLKGVVQARGIVEDLADGVATARLVSAAKPGLVLQPGDPVRFVEPDGVAPTADPSPALIQSGGAVLQMMK